MPRQIFLFQPINASSSEIFVRQLFDLDRFSNEEVTILINSPGGSVVDFFAMYDALEIVKSPIRTVVLGQASSAAAILAACGDTRLITENSEFMLHEVWSFIMGNVNEIGQKADRMKKMQEKLVGILEKKTGKPSERLMAVMKDQDKYFSAAEAVRFGLADRVIKGEEMQALKLSEGINLEGVEVSVNKDGNPEIEILREGKFDHPLYGEIVITDNILNQMKNNFDEKVRGIDVSIDYTHDNDNGERPAAFWIRKLDVVQNGKGKVLKAVGEFTPAGQKKVSEKEYKYASADFVVDYVTETGKHFPYVLRGGTLTNRPFIKGLNPIKLSEYQPQQKETSQMEKEALIQALKGHGIDVVNIQAQYDALKAEKEGLENKIRELSALPAQKEEEITALKSKVDELNTQIVNSEKEQAFNSLLGQGKVVPAQKESLFKAFAKAEDLSAAFKDAPVVVKTQAKGSSEEGDDQTLTPDEEKVVASGELTRDEVIQNRKFNKKK